MTNNYDITGHVTRRGAKKQASWYTLEGQFLINLHLKNFSRMSMNLDTTNCDTHHGMMWKFGDDQANSFQVMNKMFFVKNLLSYIIYHLCMLRGIACVVPIISFDCWCTDFLMIFSPQLNGNGNICIYNSMGWLYDSFISNQSFAGINVCPKSKELKEWYPFHRLIIPPLYFDL